MLSKPIAILALSLSAHFAFAAGQFELPNATVGHNLQTSVKIRLTEPAPEAGIIVTVKSSDPASLRLSKQAETAGSESIALEVRVGFDETQEFWVQGLADKGEIV